MIKAVIDGRLIASEEFVEHMYHCLDCRNCQSVCPAGVKVGELVLEARHRIEEHVPQPLIKRLILNRAIRDQKTLSYMLSPLRLYQHLGIQWLVRKSRALNWISSDLEFMEALLPPLPTAPLADTIPEVIPAIGPEKGRVGFFLGCAMNLIFADISRDTIDVLTRAGFTVVVPKNQQCCGTPNIAEGERHVYREMAEHNVRLFEGKGLDAIVTDCAACGSELKAYRETLSKQRIIAGKPKNSQEKSVTSQSSSFPPWGRKSSLGQSQRPCAFTIRVTSDTDRSSSTRKEIFSAASRASL